MIGQSQQQRSFWERCKNHKFHKLENLVYTRPALCLLLKRGRIVLPSRPRGWSKHNMLRASDWHKRVWDHHALDRVFDLRPALLNFTVTLPPS